MMPSDLSHEMGELHNSIYFFKKMRFRKLYIVIFTNNDTSKKVYFLISSYDNVRYMNTSHTTARVYFDVPPDIKEVNKYFTRKCPRLKKDGYKAHIYRISRIKPKQSFVLKDKKQLTIWHYDFNENKSILNRPFFKVEKLSNLAFKFKMI